MKLIVATDYQEMSELAANLLLGYLVHPLRVNLAITAGSTPQRLYELLIPYVRGRAEFANAHYYNFDEIPYAGRPGYGVTMENLHRMYFGPAEIPAERLHELNSDNYSLQDQRIAEEGGLDLIMMGVGTDGHYCGNLPGTTVFSDRTCKVPISTREDMRQILLKEVGGHEKWLPDHYVTMGPKSVMAAKKLLVIVNGSHKAEIVKRIIDGPVDATIPASLLMLHPNLLIIADREAASLL